MTTTSKARQARRKAKAKPPSLPLSSTPVVLPEIKPEYKTITVRPTPELISAQAYWKDIRNRSSIHAYEVNEAMNDLRTAVQWTYVQYNKLCAKIKEVAP